MPHLDDRRLNVDDKDDDDADDDDAEDDDAEDDDKDDDDAEDDDARFSDLRGSDDLHAVLQLMQDTATERRNLRGRPPRRRDHSLIGVRGFRAGRRGAARADARSR